MKIRGLGGTDFRSVFRYVKKFQKEKEFQNLRGLIYFTDGYGMFPERKPDYETAFEGCGSLEKINLPDSVTRIGFLHFGAAAACMKSGFRIV